MTDIRQPHEQQPASGDAGQYPPPYGYGYGYGYGAPAGTGYPQQGGPYVPPQGPWGPQGQWPMQGGWGGPQPPQPKNSLAMPTLILGIVTLGLSPLPFLNQAGILVGIVGAGLGIAAVVIGVRRRIRLVMAAIGLALSVLGVISAIAFTEAFVNDLNNIGSSVSSGPAVPAQSVGGTEESAAVTSYTLSITGSASKTSVNWSVDGSSGSAGQSTKVPWTKVMTVGSDSWHSASLSAYTYPGTSGDLTCTITDQAGRVLDTKSASSQGGDYGSASVNCNAFGS
ncbi:hypothetical protein [Actinomycetospora termitidis]|uniref:Ig-like domain-containing protein n=1 Tax=Actinomycetospora termitidis TaxID=3053470 RepID=A0ABT7M3Z3_9PSEU|nr:hypothetical protein [Actinomycetospora sp. Odt1-22]MDL5155379.1 hypothetical protein [Actinomycetospora sp. Odt1-22]